MEPRCKSFSNKCEAPVFFNTVFFYNGTEHYLSNRADQISSLLSGESDYEPDRRSREDGVADRFPELDIGKHTTEGDP